MRYYHVEQDESIIDYPLPVDISPLYNSQFLNKAYEYRTSQRVGLDLVDNEFIVFPDIFINGLLLCSAEAKSVLVLHEPSLEFRQVVFLNRKMKQLMLYHQPKLAFLDCIGSGPAFHQNGKLIKNLILKNDTLHDETIFNVAGAHQPTYVMRQDIVEGLLARNMVGFSLKLLSEDTE